MVVGMTAAYRLNEQLTESSWWSLVVAAAAAAVTAADEAE